MVLLEGVVLDSEERPCGIRARVNFHEPHEELGRALGWE